MLPNEDEKSKGLKRMKCDEIIKEADQRQEEDNSNLMLTIIDTRPQSKKASKLKADITANLST